MLGPGSSLFIVRIHSFCEATIVIFNPNSINFSFFGELVVQHVIKAWFDKKNAAIFYNKVLPSL